MKVRKNVLIFISVFLLIIIFISCTSSDMRRKNPYYVIEEVEEEFYQWGYISKNGDVLLDFQWHSAGTFFNEPAETFAERFKFVARFPIPIGLGSKDIS